MIFTILLVPFFVGFILHVRGKPQLSAWHWTWPIIPAFVLFNEFVLPYRGGGASMWPIALFFGGLYGAISGGVGVKAAYFYLKRKNS